MTSLQLISKTITSPQKPQIPLLRQTGIFYLNYLILIKLDKTGYHRHHSLSPDWYLFGKLLKYSSSPGCDSPYSGGTFESIKLSGT